MDKNWMDAMLWSNEYVEGVKSFLKFVEDHMGKDCSIRCPCKNCLNLRIKPQRVVEDHLFIRGINKCYRNWFYHGEPSESSYTQNQSSYEAHGSEDIDEEDEGVCDMLQDISNQYFQTDATNLFINDTGRSTNALPTYLEELMKDAHTELYPGCKKISRLSVIIELLHLKVYNRLSNKALDMVLQLMKKCLPDGETLPCSYYDAKKILRDLGLGYVCIHACMYDCALFWKDNQNAEACPICGTSRWKINDGKGKKVPHKILRYFPLKPRLQRLFMSQKTSKKMVWHKEKRIDDEFMRHPADSEAWKDFDNKFPWFASEPRNVRLALAADGFNPFGNLSTKYSMWPVILAPLNLPPWDCMKQPFFMMTLLIPGPKSPGKDIDVFLQPLIEELKQLWVEGVETFDVSLQKNFKMHAAVLWTINDFPAFGDLSGWSTKGYMACPTCNDQTCSVLLRNKIGYMGHRRYLPKDHSLRRSRKFNGKKEDREPPKELTGDDVLKQLDNLGDSTPGKHPDNRKRKRTPSERNWTKRSIFFELPYWSKLKLRHNLDVMHIEKNICESILGTLMTIDGKNKDTVKARLDMEDMGIRKELHLIKRTDGKYEIPAACYVMNKKERHDFCEFLKSIKFPDGYASNISRCVTSSDQTLSGLKSHDCHVLLQRILPVGIRGSLRKDVSVVLAELGYFFQRLCCKKLKRSEVEKMGDEICLILCKLEMIYPPAFFDVMVHLPIHLANEALIGGPVQFRWMYPIERSLCGLKQSVSNKAYPEGSIAEAYIAKECLTFCSMYMQGVETRFNRNERNHDLANMGGISIFSQNYRPFGSTNFVELPSDEFNMVQWFVLQNCEEVEPYFQKHMEALQLDGCTNIDQVHKQRFPLWFKQHMTQVYRNEPSDLNEALYSLACAPRRCVKKYSGCIVNGVRFLIKERDDRRRSQNSGIAVEGNHGDLSIDFYGELNEIVELDYVKDKHVTLFKCDWFDLGKRNSGIQKEGNITSIKVIGRWYVSDSYILADQARQVFYINDPKLGSDWRVVQPFQHRHIYDVDEMQDETMDFSEGSLMEDEVYQENEMNDIVQVELDDITSLTREDVDDEDINSLIIPELPEDGEDENIIDVDEIDELDDTLVDYCTSDEENQSDHNPYDDDIDE